MPKKNRKGYCLDKNDNRVDIYQIRENDQNSNNIGTGDNRGEINQNNFGCINIGELNDNNRYDLRDDESRINID